MQPTILLVISFLLIGCFEQPAPKKKPSEAMIGASTKALTLCAGCHGPGGISPSPDNPNLAGQKKAYLVKQLMDFRTGKRANSPSMTYISRLISEQEISLISEWYSRQ
ncbi:cytochrome c [Candidatus Sororendozoicomonas aggregata]|uniref:c-type cytochrome n=1 Tax=Candidatus Sororendozoicomonas aggregata TaxID=3073239 RepID=UPI002ED06E12